MKTDYDIIEMAGWVATLPEFRIGVFQRTYPNLTESQITYCVDIFRRSGLIGPIRGQKKSKQIVTYPPEVLITDIGRAKAVVSELITDKDQLRNIDINL